MQGAQIVLVDPKGSPLAALRRCPPPTVRRPATGLQRRLSGTTFASACSRPRGTRPSPPSSCVLAPASSCADRARVTAFQQVQKVENGANARRRKIASLMPPLQSWGLHSIIISSYSSVQALSRERQRTYDLYFLGGANLREAFLSRPILGRDGKRVGRLSGHSLQSRALCRKDWLSVRLRALVSSSDAVRMTRA